jgi:hypothetical protein
LSCAVLALTIKSITGGTGFGAGRTWEPFSPVKGNETAEKGIDRFWGISGGFPDCVPVIIEIAGIEAGCWRVIVYLAGCSTFSP